MQTGHEYSRSTRDAPRPLIIDCHLSLIALLRADQSFGLFLCTTRSGAYEPQAACDSQPFLPKHNNQTRLFGLAVLSTDLFVGSTWRGDHPQRWAHLLELGDFSLLQGRPPLVAYVALDLNRRHACALHAPCQLLRLCSIAFRIGTAVRNGNSRYCYRKYCVYTGGMFQTANG